MFKAKSTTYHQSYDYQNITLVGVPDSRSEQRDQLFLGFCCRYHLKYVCQGIPILFCTSTQDHQLNRLSLLKRNSLCIYLCHCILIIQCQRCLIRSKENKVCHKFHHRDCILLHIYFFRCRLMARSRTKVICRNHRTYILLSILTGRRARLSYY